MADSQKYKPLLPDNPLCGISRYKDTLNLATGACTRQIKKLVLTGDENIQGVSQLQAGYRFTIYVPTGKMASAQSLSICTHFVYNPNWTQLGFVFGQTDNQLYIIVDITGVNDKTTFANWLATQYANGTPVTIWYVLETATTETVTVPTGLSGTEEGYLTQSETPTPTNPVCPTANEVLIWQHSLRKLTTATETIENPLYSDGTAITNYTIKGNTVQNGTPTPSNPVDVQGVGVRTDNLIDYTASEEGGIDASGNPVIGNVYWRASTFTPVNVSDSYCCNFKNVALFRLYYYDSQKNYISREEFNAASVATMPANTAYIKWSLYDSNRGITLERVATFDLMVSQSNTPLPYEPYGYKIPFLTNQTTTNIYLESVQSYREIKKYVCTGKEQWQSNGDGTDNAFFYIDLEPPNAFYGLSTHFTKKNIWSSNTVVGFGFEGTKILRIRPDNAATLTTTSFKQWLAAQYANGTPVTMYYVLATPETAIVNEPLMKIGDYADTLSNAAQIPTTEGANSITVDTTVQPSEFTATWTGWHDANVKEWDGSQWNE